jgi:hypothetical protein
MDTSPDNMRFAYVGYVAKSVKLEKFSPIPQVNNYH